MAEKKYIDAGELLKSLCDDNPAAMEDYYYNAIKCAPAADVVEVRHGEWYVSEYEYLKCSVCGEAVYMGFDVTAEEDLQKQLWMNYCPNCGAKMDGGADNG